MAVASAYRLTVTSDIGGYEFNAYYVNDCATNAGAVLQGGATVAAGVPTQIALWAVSGTPGPNLMAFGNKLGVASGTSITWTALWEYQVGGVAPWLTLRSQTQTNLTHSGGFTDSSCGTSAIPAPPPSPCVSRIKASMPAVQVLDNAILGAALALIPSSWWGDVLGWFLGFTLDVNVLCSGLPPTVSSIATTALINPGQAGLDVLYATLWPYYCECTPATPPAVDPPKPTPVQPPDWPPPKTFPPNPTNPCLDISDVRRMLTQLLQLVQRDLELDGLVQRYELPFATVPGPTHTGLSGSGTIAVERLLGVLITWTDGDPAAVWEGTPPYFKDLGWLSANDGGAMLIETRVTRQQQLWMPKGMQLATTIGYFAKPGIQLAIQEIRAEV